jgi:ABC-type oligopeptide transport system ATPase subunit
MKPLRQEMQMVFQDPYASLNPRMTVGDIVGEPLLIHKIGSKKDRIEKVADMLKRVGLLPEHMHRYPHAFSGGQRQRIGIARALILRPALVVADEAVSALDVSVQAQILDLLRELQREFQLTYLFVAHNLAVVRTFCDKVAVMYRGKIMELGPTPQVLVHPRHAYTKVLLSAVPRPDPDFKMQPLNVADLTPDQLQPCDPA